MPRNHIGKKLPTIFLSLNLCFYFFLFLFLSFFSLVRPTFSFVQIKYPLHSLYHLHNSEIIFIKLYTFCLADDYFDKNKVCKYAPNKKIGLAHALFCVSFIVFSQIIIRLELFYCIFFLFCFLPKKCVCSRHLMFINSMMVISFDQVLKLPRQNKFVLFLAQLMETFYILAKKNCVT